ncbi:MAG TPA: hypothetical protein VLX91_13540 [Candidatus Acidoferrales bacterium]|nr:hypothetical protein [Candidatus Acidoferrales bacterium]
MKSFGVTLVCALAMAGVGMAQYKLEYKASSAIHYKAHTTLETVETMMGQEQHVNVVSDQSLTISSVISGDELIFSTVIDSGENIAIMPNGDTNHVPSPALGKIKETRIKPNGEEISTRWIDTAFANSPAGQAKDFGSFFLKLPSTSVGEGATWNQTRTDTAGTPGSQGKIAVTTNTDYKLVGKENLDGISCVKIAFAGKVKLKGSATINGMNLAIDGSGTINGTALFDYSAGKAMKISGTSDQELVMATAGENAMTIPMSQKTNYDLISAK